MIQADEYRFFSLDDISEILKMPNPKVACKQLPTYIYIKGALEVINLSESEIKCTTDHIFELENDWELSWTYGDFKNKYIPESLKIVTVRLEGLVKLHVVDERNDEEHVYLLLNPHNTCVVNGSKDQHDRFLLVKDINQIDDCVAVQNSFNSPLYKYPSGLFADDLLFFSSSNQSKSGVLYYFEDDLTELAQTIGVDFVYDQLLFEKPETAEFDEVSALQNSSQLSDEYFKVREHDGDVYITKELLLKQLSFENYQRLITVLADNNQAYCHIDTGDDGLLIEEEERITLKGMASIVPSTTGGDFSIKATGKCIVNGKRPSKPLQLVDIDYEITNHLDGPEGHLVLAPDHDGVYRFLCRHRSIYNQSIFTYVCVPEVLRLVDELGVEVDLSSMKRSAQPEQPQETGALTRNLKLMNYAMVNLLSHVHPEVYRKKNGQPNISRISSDIERLFNEVEYREHVWKIPSSKSLQHIFGAIKNDMPNIMDEVFLEVEDYFNE